MGMDLEQSDNYNSEDSPLIEASEEIQANQSIYNEYFTEDFAKLLSDKVLSLLSDIYFRTEFVGFDDTFPERNNPNHPIIYICNHSGMSFPWDAMILMSMYFKKTGYQLNKAFRGISAPILSQSVLMNPFMIPNLWKRAGGIDATFLNFETMMHYKDAQILIYPEGVAGIGKGFNNRYKLQRFSSSFIYNCIKYKTKILGTVTVNGEYLNPWAYSSKWVNRFVNKLGIPFFPLTIITPFLLIFPWMFYMGFPAKLTYVRCREIFPHELTSKNINDLSREELRAIAEKCRVLLQEDLDNAVKNYGQSPYQFKEFFKSIIDNWKLFPYTIPPAWPLLFYEFDRIQKVYEATGEIEEMQLGWGSTLRIIFRNPILLCYYIPILGWIPLLIKGYTKVD